MSSTEAVAREVAESEFDRFLDAMDIRGPDERSDEKERSSFDGLRDTVLSAMVAGRLVIDADGCPVFTPKMGNQDPITFHEPKGSTYMAMDGKKETHRMAQVQAAIAEMTRQPTTRFVNMRNRDFKVCQALFTLFFS